MSSASTQIVLITGANQGLGYFAALQLAQLPGYHIFLGSRNPQKGIGAVAKIQAEGVKSMIEPLELDVDSDTSIAAAVKIVEAKFGKLDVLVNNAGHNLDQHPDFKSGKISLRENLLGTYQTNVFGLACLSEAALPLLAKSTFPRIINISSGLGSLTTMSDKDGPRSSFRFVAYNSSKTAINGMGVHYADALRKSNPSSLVISLDPGNNATHLTNYQGIQDPKVGANGYVVAITQGPETTWKSGEFRDQFGKIVPW